MTDVVCRLPNGATLYREANGAGGHRYWSDEVGGGVCLWDTCLVDEYTLLAAIVEERRRVREEQASAERSDPMPLSSATLLQASMDAAARKLTR